jgi:hypothetical protein
MRQLGLETHDKDGVIISVEISLLLFEAGPAQLISVDRIVTAQENRKVD